MDGLGLNKNTAIRAAFIILVVLAYSYATTKVEVLPRIGA